VRVRSSVYFVVILILAVMLNCSNGFAFVNLGTYGATWPIKEQDALVQIKQALKKFNWKKVFNKQNYLRAFHEYENRISTNLPRTKKHKIYTVDMTYTLQRNIVDAQGKIIYPKGYTFNPLNYVKMPFDIVVINADDKAQVKWFMHSKYYNKIKTMLLICKGDVITLEKKVKMPVFYADRRIVERFHLEAVPSVIYQKGEVMYVEEIPVKVSSGGNGSSHHNNNNTK